MTSRSCDRDVITPWDRKLVTELQGALGSEGQCQTSRLKCVSSSCKMKTLTIWTSPPVPQTWIRLNTSGTSCLTPSTNVTLFHRLSRSWSLQWQIIDRSAPYTSRAEQAEQCLRRLQECGVQVPVEQCKDSLQIPALIPEVHRYIFFNSRGFIMILAMINVNTDIRLAAANEIFMEYNVLLGISDRSRNYNFKPISINQVQSIVNVDNVLAAFTDHELMMRYVGYLMESVAPKMAYKLRPPASSEMHSTSMSCMNAHHDDSIAEQKTAKQEPSDVAAFWLCSVAVTPWQYPTFYDGPLEPQDLVCPGVPYERPEPVWPHGRQKLEPTSSPQDRTPSNVPCIEVTDEQDESLRSLLSGTPDYHRQ
ncbi:unnamed protein product [Ranitomeya imitator]|uniref:Uncharacterized protein n=1 Tax=Ranitomeya imitator TaxID=111125 RepID=A0ABN9KX05_9NEOB|nr:unnamed protein product [Ranitomeya imitator]